MIKISNLNKVFKNKKRKIKALDNINITFDSKGLCFILGSSGAGKTTLLNILSLQSKPTSGSMVIDDLDTSKLSDLKLASIRNNYFGIVFQELNLIEDFNVYQNIIIGLEIQKKTIDKEEVIQILKNLNLPDNILEEKIYNLSGGQKQRVAIARALIKDSKVIICDEPTGSLDETNSIEIMKILKDISKDRLVIVVSHNKELANEFGDRIITLVDGQIKSDTNTLIESSETNKMVMNKKVHLPFKFVSKIALSTFKNCIPKLVFTLISVMLTIFAILSLITICSYDSEKVFSKILDDENIMYFDLKKYNNSNASYFTNNDLLKIDTSLDKQYVPAHSSNDISRAFSLNRNNEVNRPPSTIKNTVCISNEMLNSLGFNILGRLPNNQENCYEMSLTKYECYSLGWIEQDEMNNNQVLEDIINNKTFKVVIFSSSYNYKVLDFKIVGIIDTNYKVYNQNDYLERNRYESQLLYEMHTDVFVSEKIFKEIINISIVENNVSEEAYHDIYVLSNNNNFKKTDDLRTLFSENNEEIKKYSQIDYIETIATNMSDLYSKVLYVIILVFSIIAILFFLGFIKSSIDINAKKIKILRALGITIIDSNNIFYLQTFIIILICMIISLIPLNIVIPQVNNYLKSMFSTPTNILEISFVTILLVFLGLLVIALLITTIINIIKFNDKKLKIEEE